MATENDGYTTVEFDRDTETSDTVNDVQFKVNSFFLKNSISGWDRRSRSHTPHPREFGYKSEPSLRGGE